MHTRPHHTWTIFIDGAARHNPGHAGAGIVIQKDHESILTEGFYLGIKTNNQAEYLALLLALFFLHEYAAPDDTIYLLSDSELLVKQLLGHYQVKNEGLKPLYMLAQTMAQTYLIMLKHIVREENSTADFFANEGIDKKKQLPHNFITLLRKHNIQLE